MELTRSTRAERRLTLQAVSLVLACVLAGPISPAPAHPALAEYVRHDVLVRVDRVNIDVQIELTFHEVRSLFERHRMDVNRDGLIGVAEVKGYLARQSATCDRQVHLSINGQPLELVSLFDPELDLGEDRGVSPAHHVLRLFYFARTPASLGTGDTLAVEDGLWTSDPAVGTFQIEGEAGFRWATSNSDFSEGRADATGPWMLTARCVESPPPGNPAVTASSAYLMSAGGVGLLLMTGIWLASRRKETMDASQHAA